MRETTEMRARVVFLAVSLLLAGCRHARPAGPATLEGDQFPGKPVVRLCKKDWSHEQCCAFLCKGLGDICSDSPRSKPGIDSCPTWCPTLADKAVRCHVFHCYVSISPTGGIKDHDSHCRHASNQLPGGDCPSLVYE
jgi:hypothetical protein